MRYSMFTRVLLNLNGWRVTADFFGLGAIKATNPASETARATPQERQRLLQLMAAFRSAGAPTNAQSPEVLAALVDFAKAIHQRHRRRSAGGFAYSLFFQTYTPEEMARNYLEKFR